MKSHITKEFIDCFNFLPDRIKRTAKKNYKIWEENPECPGLSFKCIHNTKPIYSIRVGIGWRAIGVFVNKDEIIWFWIGSHADYDKILKKFSNK